MEETKTQTKGMIKENAKKGIKRFWAVQKVVFYIFGLIAVILFAKWLTVPQEAIRFFDSVEYWQENHVLVNEAEAQTFPSPKN